MAITNTFDKTYDATLIIILAAFVAGAVFLVLLNFNALRGSEEDLISTSGKSINNIRYENVYNPVVSPMETRKDSRRSSVNNLNSLNNNTDSLHLVTTNPSNPFENASFSYVEPSNNRIRQSSVISGEDVNFVAREPAYVQSAESYEENIPLKPVNSQVVPEIRVAAPDHQSDSLV